jgi:opacity protein-like surface antigen
MLKITRLTLLSGVLMASAAHAEFYIGPRIGPSFNVGKYSAALDGAGSQIKSGAGVAFFGGPSMGYLWKMDRFRLGLDVGLLFHSLNNKFAVHTNAGGTTENQSTLKNTFFYQLGLRVGFELCDKAVPFISLGMSGGNYKLTIQNATNAAEGGLAPNSTVSISKQSLGFMPGFGVLVPLAKNVQLSLEYNFITGSKLKKTFNAGRTSGTYTQRISQHTMAFGVNYTF